jgi:glycosyltransferase involved in cell wall biosynthesis
LNSIVEFTGRVPTPDLVRHYNEARLFVTSSVHEGFGLPLAEAMACGTPAIGTQIGAYQEIADHNENAWLVPPRDPRALADAIRRLWQDDALRERLGGAARQRIVERFNWRKAAEETLAVYEEVMPLRRRSYMMSGTAHAG